MIYFIQSGENGPIKIGHTDDNIKKRLDGLQTGNPQILKLLCTIDGDSVFEEKLHMRFNEYRIRGEWFFQHTELLDYLSIYTTDYQPAINTGYQPVINTDYLKTAHPIAIENAYIRMALRGTYLQKVQAARKLNLR